MNKIKIFNSGIKDVKFGSGVKVVKPVNIYGCEIGDNCFIGPFVEIQKDVTIGNNTKVQSHTFICELVSVGDNCFIGHGVMFINDLFSDGGPAKGNKELWKSTQIGNKVSIGSNATILPVSICDNVVIGAGSVVTKNIDKPGTYVGNPAKLIIKRI
ncbi:MAG: N-acetyltransferase [Bacteroidetes bacterium]|nr:N-acetyltransferase [Bacteroidota bacterium]